MKENIAQYKNRDERTPDKQYRDTLELVLRHGQLAESKQGPKAITYFCPPANRYRLDNGFPLITERSVSSFWKQAIAEICAFINGARTQDELVKFGCHFWKKWVTEEKCSKRGLETGDLGPGSYGAGFNSFPTAEGGTFNQFKHIVEQIKELPILRTHFVSPWIPQYIGRGKGKQQKVVVAPCHGWVYVRIINNELYMTMVQRSADLPVGVPSNMIQYAALAMMIGQVTGYKPVEFIHQMIDAHIYEDQIPWVEEIISREPYKFPTVTMNPNIDDLFAFRKEDFKLQDYESGPAMKDIPVAI